MLIVFGGLPGVGKTVLSREVASRLGMTWLRIDAIEAAMWRAGIPAGSGTGIGAYAVAHAVAGAQLEAGRGVVVDAVNPVEVARQGWRDLGAAHGVPAKMVEVLCSDREEHRRRVERRAPHADQPNVPAWSDVLALDYEPWPQPHLTVDTVDTVDTVEGINRCLAEIMAYVSRRD